MNTQNLSRTPNSWARRIAAPSRSGRMYLDRIAMLGLIAIVCTVSPAWAQNVLLGTAGNFGVLAGSAVTNTGPTVVNGSVGVWPGTSITGFPPGSVFPGSGTLHSADAVAQQAQSDLSAAYVDAANRVCGTTIAAGLLGGLTLTPGVYCMGAGNLTGTLTLNGPGVYIFQMASSLTTAPGSSVVLIGGASACNIFWQVTSSATIDTSTAMAGNILALSSITLNTGASIRGKALARNAATTLDNGNVTACANNAAAAGSTALPALSEWTMIVLMGLLILAAFARQRRSAI